MLYVCLGLRYMYGITTALPWERKDQPERYNSYLGMLKEVRKLRRRLYHSQVFFLIRGVKSFYSFPEP